MATGPDYTADNIITPTPNLFKPERVEMLIFLFFFYYQLPVLDD